MNNDIRSLPGITQVICWWQGDAATKRRHGCGGVSEFCQEKSCIIL